VTYFASKQQAHQHRYFIDADTQDEVCLCGKSNWKAAPAGNKFNARKSNYDGYTYDSGKEANYAAELDLLKKAGKIKAWERQYPVRVEPEGHPPLHDKGRFQSGEL